MIFNYTVGVVEIGRTKIDFMANKNPTLRGVLLSTSTLNTNPLYIYTLLRKNLCI